MVKKNNLFATPFVVLRSRFFVAASNFWTLDDVNDLRWSFRLHVFTIVRLSCCEVVSLLQCKAGKPWISMSVLGDLVYIDMLGPGLVPASAHTVGYVKTGGTVAQFLWDTGPMLAPRVWAMMLCVWFQPFWSCVCISKLRPPNRYCHIWGWWYSALGMCPQLAQHESASDMMV